MLKYILSILLVLTWQLSFAAESHCTKLSKIVDIMGESYHPPLEGKLIGNNKLYFYSSPDLQCKMKGEFVINGDSLTVYKPYKNWLNVMYIATNGEDYMAWIPSKRVKIIGQYGNNP